MKKIIGIIGVVAIAMTIFFSTSSEINETNLDLASLITINTANAEDSCCIGSKFQVTSIPGGWHCQNDAGSSCCPIC